MIEPVRRGAPYDTMGHGYGAVRRPDPRIASAIWAALGDASSVVNVGAGAGSYDVGDLDVEVLGRLWLMRDYLPETLADHAAAFPSISQLLKLLPGATSAAVLVPRDRTDGFMAAFWGRHEAYLDPAIRTATSPWHQLAPETVNRALDHLRRDLASGAWDKRYGQLRRQQELDVGLRLLCADNRPLADALDHRQT